MILWGFGKVGKIAYGILREKYDITAFADSDIRKQCGVSSYGIPVIGLKEVLSDYSNEEVILCVGGNYLKAAAQLYQDGVKISGCFLEHMGVVAPYNYMKWTKMYLDDDEKMLKDAFFSSDDLMHEKANERLENLFEYAYEYSPFYRNRLDVAGYKKGMKADEILAVLDRLLVLYREDIFYYERNIKSTLFDYIPHYEIHTSGTTGVPLKMYSSVNLEESHQNFLYKMMLGDLDNDVDYSRIVSFGSSNIPNEKLSSNIFWQDYPIGLYGIKDFSVKYLDSNNIEHYISELEKVQPYILRGYASAVDLFVKTCLENGIIPNIKLKGIYLTSENVYNEQVLRISHFFRCGVYGQYGNHEVTHFGFTKSLDDRYYCSPLYGIVQVVDPNGKHVLKGETGRVVVTSLANYAMPIIKYFTGDIAVYGGVKNGFIVLDRLIGRDQEYVLNKEGKKVFIAVSTLDNHKLLSMNHIYNWQAVQQKDGAISLKIVRKPEFSDYDEESIIKALSEESIDVKIEYVNEIPLGKTGKREIVIHT